MNTIDTIDKFLANNRSNRPTIYCIGDCMIDEYVVGEINRTSPEAPVPVFLSHTNDPIRRPGGVANVAYQLKNFNVDSRLIAFTQPVVNCVFFDPNLTTSSSLVNVRKFDEKGHVPVKKRFLAHGIQVFRHDIEESNYGVGEDGVNLLQKELFTLINDLPMPDVAILSDYNKGFFSSSHAGDWNWYFRYHSAVITIIDPKEGPAFKWAGCSIFKPNAKEARIFTSETDPRKQVDVLRNQLGPSTKIVITMGGDGVAGWDGEYFEYRPKKHVQVESVIGAGDCFVAVLALAVAHKMSIIEAVEVAYRAGEIYVQNRFNRPIVAAELSTTKIVEPEDLLNRDFKLVFTNGCFDGGLTLAHVQYLSYAKSLGDKLVVAVNGDNSVKKIKGANLPIFDLQERIGVLAGLECVDFVTSFEEETPLNIIKKLHPALVVKGGDYRPEDVVGYGITEVVVSEKFDATSTTEKIEKVIKNWKK
jgi:D-beta-D-heptose 7-phosphate kinase / D-beta-D-heptose 1-phosphate adenosyltransferase